MNRLSVLDRVIAATVGVVGAAVVTLLGLSLRVERLGPEEDDVRSCGPRRRIFAFWHGELLPLACTHRGRDICVLVSRHRDGECAARVLRRIGFHTARGSTSDAGVEGAFQMCASLKNGRDAAVAPDGPRGPMHTVQPGIVCLAQRTGAGLVPVACRAKRHLRLGTWDGFQVPLPFSKVVVVSRPPIAVPRHLSGAEVEEYRTLLERALVEAGESAGAALRGAE